MATSWMTSASRSCSSTPPLRCAVSASRFLSSVVGRECTLSLLCGQTPADRHPWYGCCRSIKNSARYRASSDSAAQEGLKRVTTEMGYQMLPNRILGEQLQQFVDCCYP